jgi:hypothetical protein
MQNEKRELTYLDYCGLWHKEREFALETICWSFQKIENYWLLLSFSISNLNQKEKFLWNFLTSQLNMNAINLIKFILLIFSVNFSRNSFGWSRELWVQLTKIKGLWNWAIHPVAHCNLRVVKR